MMKILIGVLFAALCACSSTDKKDEASQSAQAEQPAEKKMTEAEKKQQDFKNRKDTFMSEYTSKLDTIEKNLDSYKTNPQMVKLSDDARRILREARLDLNDVRKADMQDFESERSNFILKFNDLQAKVSNLK